MKGFCHLEKLRDVRNLIGFNIKNCFYCKGSLTINNIVKSTKYNNNVLKYYLTEKKCEICDITYYETL